MTLEIFTNIEFLCSLHQFISAQQVQCNFLPKSKHKIHFKTTIFHKIVTEISEPIFFNFEFYVVLHQFISAQQVQCNFLPKSKHKIHFKTTIFHKIVTEISEPIFFNFEQNILYQTDWLYQNQLVIISFIK